MNSAQTRKVTQRIEFVIGMQVMVTLNVATEADLANGSRGIIHDIILDPREQIASEDVNDDGIVWLQYPPAMILFQPFHHEFDPFPGLEAASFPSSPQKFRSTFIITTTLKPKSTGGSILFVPDMRSLITKHRDKHSGK
jgi:hypothetical protein